MYKNVNTIKGQKQKQKAKEFEKQMTENLLNVSKGCFVTALVTYIVSNWLSNSSWFSVITTTYAFVLLGLSMGVLKIIYEVFSAEEQRKDASSSSIRMILQSTGPTWILMCHLMFTLIQHCLHGAELSSSTQKVDANYYLFSSLYWMLVFIQVYLLFQFSSSSSMLGVEKPLYYMFALLSILCAVIMYIQLEYFTTDG